MKINKTMSALAVTLGPTAVAQAQTPVYITGSTAFRKQIFNALVDLGLTANQGNNGSNSFTLSGTVADATGGSLNLSTVAPGLAGTSVDVYCTFSGSAEGLNTIINLPAITYDTAASSGTFSYPNGADIAFSDVYQNTTSFSTHLTGDQLEEVVLSSDMNRLPKSGVAVQPFAMVVNGNASAIHNITSANIIDTFKVGSNNLSFFTGVATDSNTIVKAVGRYNLSGTRYATINDNNWANPLNQLHQFGLSTDGTTVNGLASTDPNAPAGNIWVDLGTAGGGNGYFTGGNVGLAIDTGTVNGASAAVAYIGWADAQSKLTHGGGEGPISIDGQTPGSLGSWNLTGVENGSYFYWNYEHLYVTDGDQSTFIDQTFAPGLIDAIQYEILHTSPRTAVLESEMNVYKNGEAGDITHY